MRVPGWVIRKWSAGDEDRLNILTVAGTPKRGINLERDSINESRTFTLLNFYIRPRKLPIILHITVIFRVFFFLRAKILHAYRINSRRTCPEIDLINLRATDYTDTNSIQQKTILRLAKLFQQNFLVLDKNSWRKNE